MNYIKSPLNYTGGKFKLLPQILPLFPSNINTFVDLFCGGVNVAVNVKAKNKVCNDLESHVVDFYNNIKSLTGEEARIKIIEIVDKYGLSKTNQEGFSQCREDYNKNQTWDMFYSVISHAFNYQIRYNNQGKYNMPFGKERSCFSKQLQEKFIKFVDSVDNTYAFINKDFRELKIDKLSKDDLVYCDPPYLVTTASYNENGGWTEKDEYDLLELLDKLNEKGIKFALSNVLECKGKSNDILKEWSKKYIVQYLNYDYSNCNYHAKDKSTDSTIEVLITNYNKCGDCVYYGDCKQDNSNCEYAQ